MSMREKRKIRREARRAALRNVAAAPSFQAVRTKRTRPSKLRRALLVSSILAVLLAVTMSAPKLARADFMPAAPEIDPSSMAGALTLLVGGVLALTDRNRRV